MRSTEKMVYNIILGSMTLIILGLAMFIFTSALEFNTAHESLIGFLGILGGAFLGAWLAGRYAIKAAMLTVNEKKLLNSEDFRKLLMIHGEDLYHVMHLSNFIIHGELSKQDLKAAAINIAHHARIIKENFDLNSIPTDYYQKIRMLITVVRKLENYAFMKDREIEDKSLYDKDNIEETIKNYEKELNDLFQELQLND